MTFITWGVGKMIVLALGMAKCSLAYPHVPLLSFALPLTSHSYNGNESTVRQVRIKCGIAEATTVEYFLCLSA